MDFFGGYSFLNAGTSGLTARQNLNGFEGAVAVGTSAKSNVLAGAGGGGVQWNVSRHVALRVSGDYVLSRFGGLNQNNIRAAVGLVIGAGSVRGE